LSDTALQKVVASTTKESRVVDSARITGRYIRHLRGDLHTCKKQGEEKTEVGYIETEVYPNEQRIAEKTPHRRSGQIKILIADDHVLIREGLKKILKSASDINVVSEAQDAQEVFDQLDKNEVDVVVLDISFPGKSGLEILKDLKQQYPKLPVLILSMHPEDRFATRSFKAGAAGYITKDSAAEELIRAIRKVVDSRKYVSSSLAEKLAFNLESDAGKPLHETLSDREYQVLCMIAMGKTVKNIAAELSLSINTINTYRARVLEKMKMSKDAELIRYALQNRLVE
jgi:two-component system, NarL family, invasion response regulator UvrY